MHCRVHAINPRIGEKKKTARHRAAPKEAPQIYRAPSPWWRSRYHSEWLLAMIAFNAFQKQRTHAPLRQSEKWSPRDFISKDLN
mgnify:CR=1 FL=1